LRHYQQVLRFDEGENRDERPRFTGPWRVIAGVTALLAAAVSVRNLALKKLIQIEFGTSPAWL
jgi:hypothetical protein